MADITLKLIWYRLNETFSKMAEAGVNMESWFKWEEHLLDVLLVFWISVGLLVVGISNSLTQFFGPLQPRVSWDKGRDGPASRSVVEGPIKPESTFWLNQALNWFYLHYSSLPEFVDAWIVALNEQAVKLGGPVQVKFEKVDTGSLPPKFGDVTYDAGPEDKYVLNCRVDSRDLSFAVFASQQTHEGVKLTNLTVTILKLKGQLKIQCYRKQNDMIADIGFLGRPDIKVQGKPANPYQDASDLVDVGVVEEVVRNTLCMTSTTFNVSQWIGGSNRQCEVIPIQRQRSNEMRRSTEPQPPPSPRPIQQLSQQQQAYEQSQPVFEPQQVFEAIEVQEAQKQHSAFPVSIDRSSPEPLSPSSRLRFEQILQDLETQEDRSSPESPICISPQSFEPRQQMFDFYQDLETIQEQEERNTPEFHAYQQELEPQQNTEDYKRKGGIISPEPQPMLYVYQGEVVPEPGLETYEEEEDDEESVTSEPILELEPEDDIDIFQDREDSFSPKPPPTLIVTQPDIDPGQGNVAKDKISCQKANEAVKEPIENNSAPSATKVELEIKQEPEDNEAQEEIGKPEIISLQRKRQQQVEPEDDEWAIEEDEKTISLEIQSSPTMKQQQDARAFEYSALQNNNQQEDEAEEDIWSVEKQEEITPSGSPSLEELQGLQEVEPQQFDDATDIQEEINSLGFQYTASARQTEEEKIETTEEHEETGSVEMQPLLRAKEEEAKSEKDIEALEEQEEITSQEHHVLPISSEHKSEPKQDLGATVAEHKVGSSFEIKPLQKYDSDVVGETGEEKTSLKPESFPPVSQQELEPEEEEDYYEELEVNGEQEFKAFEKPKNIIPPEYAQGTRQEFEIYEDIGLPPEPQMSQTEKSLEQQKIDLERELEAIELQEVRLTEPSPSQQGFEEPSELEAIEVQQWNSSPGPKRQPVLKQPDIDQNPEDSEPEEVTEAMDVQVAPKQESVHSNETMRSPEPQPIPGSDQQVNELTGVGIEHQEPASVDAEVQEGTSEEQSDFHVPTVTTPPKQLTQRPQPQRLGSEKRLLTKVIKASGLNQNAGSVDPYCVVYVDTPPQTEVTNVVRSTFNPFWDEQFYFDLTKDSQMIRFEILDRHRPANDNFLGEAVVYCEDLQRNPSSRQIIPLHGRNGGFAIGSITVEFLCSDPLDSVNMTDAISPRRMIETSKSVTPEGTVITTTMTTTQKPHNSRLDANIDGSPSYIEKRGFDYEPIDQDRSSSALRSSTIESVPTDDEDGRYLMSSSAGSPEVNSPKDHPKEKKSFASRIRKRFSRSKKRSQSADRARSSSSLREGSNYLRPPTGPQSKDDMEIYRKKKESETPNLKKSKSLGGSLKKLFRRSRKRSRSLGRGEQSRESSVSRQSRHTSQVPSREGSLTRLPHNTGQQDTVIL